MQIVFRGKSLNPQNMRNIIRMKINSLKVVLQGINT